MIIFSCRLLLRFYVLKILTTCIYGTCHHFVFTFAEKKKIKATHCINVLKKINVSSVGVI